MTDSLKSLATGIWWLILLRGVLAIIFGIIALLSPGIALVSLVVIVGVYWLVDGIAETWHALRNRQSETHWGWLLFQAIVSVLAALAVLIFPAIAATFGGLFVLWAIAIYAIVHGAAGIASAAGAPEGQAKTWGIVAGVATIVFGVIFAILILTIPGATLVGLIWTIGVYAIVFGITLIVAAVQVRGVVRSFMQKEA